MADTPNEAAAPAPAGETVATPININTEQAKAPESNSVDLHGFTQEDLAGMRTFIDNNGGWDKIKSRISNPESVQKPAEDVQATSKTKNESQPISRPQTPLEPKYKAPEGSITAQEFLAQQYFQGLSRDPKYEVIADQIVSGDILKEMSAFNIQALNQDGSINDGMVRKFLDLKAQTVPAKPTGTEPDASVAPTVSYTEVGEGGITSLDQAYKIIMEPGNPKQSVAEEYIKSRLNPNSQNNAKKVVKQSCLLSETTHCCGKYFTLIVLPSEVFSFFAKFYGYNKTMLDMDKTHWEDPCPPIDCKKKKCCCGLAYVEIPATLASKITPKNGDYTNAIVKFDGTGEIWIYSAEGVPVKIKEGEQNG